MKYNRYKNKFIRFIIVFCLIILFQTEGFSVYGRGLFAPSDKPEKLRQLYSSDKSTSTRDFDKAVFSEPTIFSEPAILRASPDGEEDPEIIGADKEEAPVEDAIPFILALTGLYILICMKKRRKKNAFM